MTLPPAPWQRRTAAAPLLILLSRTLAGCSTRSAPAAPPSAPPRAEAPSPAAGGGNGGGASSPRPYAQVIPAGAVTSEGLFRTHMVDARIYFEIPVSALGKEMILLTRNTAGLGGGPVRHFRWEREGNRVHLRQQNYDVAAEPEAAISRAVMAMARGPIIATFPIEAFGADSAAVLEVTRLFTGAVAEFGAIRGIVQDRSFVERVTAFDRGVNVVGTQTGMSAPQGSPAGTPAEAQTQRLHWSLMLLPEQPMLPRLHDSRVGFISVSFLDYSRPDHASATRRFIRRYRLEKKDPAAPLSDPVQPILYYVDPATPEWLVPFVISGVRQWIPAFESAGFSNAIDARLAPSEEEDPEFSMHDLRNSVIYWRPSTVANATGGQTPDPRTGEILRGEVNMYHNVQNLLRNWYFTQVGPLDPRASSLPLPDTLMGKLVEYVVAHEIGHAIGFPHNFKAAGMYPPDSLRSESFLRRMGGHVPTLMDYSRFNYVAQPEDGIPAELLIPQVGPYDHFAVKWGHTPIPGAATPDEELPTLDGWARMQDTIPWYRFDTPGTTNDPTQLTEAVGNSNAVQSSELGLRNLDRVMDMMLRAAERPGEDYSVLQELYGNAVDQWGRYNGHVAAVIGGAESQEKRGTGERFAPVSRERQREAVRFLSDNAFRTPERFIRPDILRRIEPEGALTRIRNAQASVLRTLLNETRMARLVEYEAIRGGGPAPYSPTELMQDLRGGIWGELQAGRVVIDVYRRNLQRAHLHQIDQLLNPPAAPGQGATPPPAPPLPSDLRPVLRAELREIDRQVRGARGRSGDAMTRIHLDDVSEEIGRILAGS